MKKLSKLLALVLALIMCMSCASAVELDADAEPKYDPFGKYDPPITVTSVHTASDNYFWFYEEGDDISNNVYTRRYAEQLGINYEFLWTAPMSQGYEKLNNQIATQELPDFFQVSTAQFEQLVQAGQLEDLTQVIQDYATPVTKKFMTGEYAGLLDAVTRDGKIYGIPSGTSYLDSAYMMWIRTDWLENVNLEAPTTMEELEKVMDAFVNQDPDQNGEKDTYAIATSSYDIPYNIAMFNMFGAYPYVWSKDGEDKLQQGMFGPDYRDNLGLAIETLSKWYEKGYIHPDIATYDDTMKEDDIYADKCGILFGDAWPSYWPLNNHVVINPDAKWLPFPLVSATEEPARISATLNNVDLVVVARKGVENPEALVKMTNLYHELNTEPATEFDVFNTDPIDNNNVFLMYPLYVYNPAFNYEGYLVISDAMENGLDGEMSGGYKLYYDQAMAYRDQNDPNGFPPYAAYSPEGAFSVQEYYVENKLIQVNEYTAPYSELRAAADPVIDKAFVTMMLDIVTGKADMTKFDEFTALYDTVYADALAEAAEWFQGQGCVSLQEAFDAE